MELIARGRTADVFDLGDGRVLRRYRTDEDVAPEAQLMAYVEELGYPVPHVYDAAGTDLVLERLDGVTLLEVLLHEPQKYRHYGRMLGDLSARLHRLPAPPWLAAEGSDADADANADPDGDPDLVVVHRDLHPQNVILSERGPVVIDWNIATGGRAAVDDAITVILMLGAEIDADEPVRRAVEPMRSMLVSAFLETCGSDPRDGLAAAIAYRSATPNNTADETDWLEHSAASCLDSFYLGQSS